MGFGPQMSQYPMGPSQQGKPLGAMGSLLSGILGGNAISQIANMGGNTPQQTPQSQSQSTALLEAIRGAMGQPQMSQQQSAAFRNALGGGSQQPGQGGARQTG